MKTQSTTNKVLVNRIIIGMGIAMVLAANTKLEAKGFPRIELQSVHEHQKELVGKNRTPSSLIEKANSKKADRMVSELVLDETTRSLPEQYKSQARSITRTIIQQANKYKMDPLFVLAVIKHESVFNPDCKGMFTEIGLMQIKPTTAEWLNKKLKLPSTDLSNPHVNIAIGTFFLSQLREKFDGDSRLYISAYNMGPANVNKLVKKNVRPKEYASKVMALYTGYLDVLEVRMMEVPFPVVASNN